MTNAESLEEAQEAVGHQFCDPSLLVRALTHASVSPNRLESNERLEFLGDAVLGLVVCQELYRRFPSYLEGELTQIKSDVVSRRTCAQMAADLGLPDLLFLGKGVGSRAQLPLSLAAAVFESLIGAIYLDGGLEAAERFILDCIDEHISAADESEHQRNFKSQLQQYAQKNMMGTPVYEMLDEQGPDHSKCFEMCVMINGRRFPSAWGPSKKEAEQKAALAALKALDLVPADQEDLQ